MEIGSGHPVDSNNTYLLESNYAWKGISIDFNADLVEEFNGLRKIWLILLRP